MRAHSVVCIRRSEDLWYVTAEGHNGLYWHDTEDGAVEEAILWACLMRPATVILVDNGRRTTIAEYGVENHETATAVSRQAAQASVAAV